ncbi:MAG: DUF2851 family protein [Opitutales bacterium]
MQLDPDYATTATQALPERLVQRLWLRQSFRQKGLRTLSGKTLRVRRPGRWNHYAGPDFRDSVLEIDGQTVQGDVEVHFRQRDWSRHGHQEDRNFSAVALHVVVFAPTLSEQPALTADGRTPETVVLLDWLERDLASLAAEELLLESTGADPIALAEPLLHLSLPELRRSLRAGALRRWRLKRRFAARRLAAHSWREACHQYLLEGLGYSRNREPFARLALKWPLERWLSERPSTELLYHDPALRWQTAGVRPPNQPWKRLEQYQRVLAARPDWPEALRALGQQLPIIADHGQTTAHFRSGVGLPAVREILQQEVLAGALGGTRLDTLTADVFLPLLAERLRQDRFAWWFHGYAGDGPHILTEVQRLLALTDARGWPRCNGWLQALLEHSTTPG